MEITTLGTGCPIPDAQRAGPSTLVRAGGLTLLVDCGRGVLVRMAGAGVGPLQLSAVLLTHLHSDHITDLNDVITTHWVMTQAPTPLRIFGPPRTAEVVDATLAMLGPDIGYRMDHHGDLTWTPQVEVTELVEGTVLDEGGARVIAVGTDHRPVEPTVGYRVEHDGKSVVLGGDGVPCEGLDSLCRDADVYVQTVLREDLVMAVPMKRFQETVDYHSTLQQAADTAKRNGVRTLVLTHMIPPPAPGTQDEWVAMVAEGGFDGEIVFADDLTTLTI